MRKLNYKYSDQPEITITCVNDSYFESNGMYKFQITESIMFIANLLLRSTSNYNNFQLCVLSDLPSQTVKYLADELITCLFEVSLEHRR